MLRFALFSTLAALLVLTAPAAAIDFGAQLIYGDDTDIGIGGRIEIQTPDLREQTRLAFDFNWYFPDESPGRSPGRSVLRSGSWERWSNSRSRLPRPERPSGSPAPASMWRRISGTSPR